MTGRVVAITGGGRGIGRATAVALRRAGAKVAVGDLDGALAERVASQLGRDCLGLALDVSDRASFARFLDDIEANLGPVDVVINNAGIMQLSRFVDEADDICDRMIDVNLRGVITGSRLALARMLPRGRGHLVNVASSAGKAGLPGAVSYSATKHGVVGLCEALRAELRGTGVEVSCVMPAMVATELTAGLEPSRGIKPVTPERVAAAIIRTLERPRFEVFVPRAAGIALGLMNLLPRRGRERLVHAFRADETFLRVDAAARRTYAERCASAEHAASGQGAAGAPES